MKFNRFEEIVAWQKAKSLTINLYAIFDNSRDFSFKDQIQKASVSIMNNIAEGFERKTNNEFKYFLYVAKGSCGEVRSMLHLSFELHKIDEVSNIENTKMTEEISKMLSGLIKTL